MLNQTSTTAIARIVLLAGILLAVTVLAARTFLPAFAQENQMDETISYDENDTEPVATYAASDPEGEGVTWKVTDPDATDEDADHLDFDITDGRLTFKNPPDFEVPEGGPENSKGNAYMAKIIVTDTSSDMRPHDWIVTVNVMNVNEAGVVSLSHPQPKEGTQLTATLTDDDGPVTLADEGPDGDIDTLTDNASTTWRWYRSESKEGPWGTPLATSTINSEHINTRTPEPEDANHFLRATAMYYDAQEPDQMRVAHGISDNAVEMKEYVNTAPMFRDDTDTEDDSQIVMSVPEDESLEEGDAVGQPVTATDIGEGGTQEVLTYSITGGDGNGEGLFTIDPASGQLKLAAADDPILDFEHDTNTDDEYVVTLEASDPSGRTGTTEVTINVTEVDEAPIIDGDVTTRTYEENGTDFVLRYTADDEDVDDVPTSLSWSLSGRDASDFDITPMGPTGTLTFKAQPNYEAPVDSGSNNVYNLVVEVEDDAGNKDTRSVTVTVTNDADLAEVTLTSHPQPEVGQTIRVTLEDDDVTGRVTWTWDIGGGSATSTQVGGKAASYTPRVAGSLTVTAAYQDSFLARETTENLSLPPNVQARPDPDRAPAFPNTEDGQRSIAENASGNVGDAVDAVDEDGDIMLYTLGGSDARSFTLASRTSGQLVVAEGTELDFERKRTYSVTVTATDPTGSSDRATKNVTITLTKEAEDPEITDGETAITYAENGRGIVETYRATDDENDAARPPVPLIWSLVGNDAADFDISTNGVLTFSSPPDYETASGNGTTTKDYEVTVVVNDGDDTTNSDDIDVVVSVTNVEEPGEVTGLPAQTKVEVPMTVTLTDDDGPVVNQVDGDDGDSDPKTITNNASTTWQWSRSRSRSSGWTPIVATSTMNMDVNTNTRTPEPADVGHYLRATAMYSDGEGDGKVAHGISTRVVLAKEYINAAPMFRDDDGETAGTQITMEVNEDDSLEAGDAVGQPVTATDIGPVGTQEILIYTLDVESGDERANQALFTIDRSSGQLKLAGADTTLDYEDNSITDNSYEVAVKAIDPSSASSTVEVTIEILPVDENPQIEAEDTDTGANLASTSTPESNATTSLSSYTAEDDEITNNNDLKWSLSGADEALFSLCTADDTESACGDVNAENSGNNMAYLWFKPSDYEAPADSGRNNRYNVTVVVTDDDEMTDMRAVEVEVTNVDENGAVTLSNLQPEVGTAIRATLDDPDGGETAVEWKWEVTPERTSIPDCAMHDGTDWDDLRAPDSLSYTPVEADAGRCLRATASYNDRAPNVDNPDTQEVDESTQKNSTSTIANFHVQAMRTTNATPQFSDQDPNLGGKQTVRYILENSVADRDVVVDEKGTNSTASPDPDAVPASDADGALTTPNDVPADVLTYSLSGSDERSFEIHPESGQITAKEGIELDYESKNTYTVIVTATDSSLARDSITVTINVVNDNEPPFVSERGLSVSGPASVSYPENESRVVATYSATGPDAAGASLTLEGVDASLFTLSSSGELTFNASPNFESAADQGGDNNYSLIVRAAMGSLADTQAVTVTVENVDEDGEVRFTSTPLVVRVGVELEAELDERDDETNVTWQWASGGSATGPWTSIGGATNATYTPLANDVGDYLQVTASYTDASFGSDSQSVVTSDAVAPESTAGTPGTLALDPTTQLTSGDSVTAILTDADNPVATSYVWRWQRSANGSTNWTNISGATSASYTTTNADAGNYLRATVTYDDSSGTGLTLDASTSSAVKLHRYDGNSDGEIQRGEVIDAINDYLFGTGTERDEVIEVIKLYLFG